MEAWSDAIVPLWLSIKVAGLATLLTVVPGALCGLLLARKSFRGKALLETVVELPLVLPPTAVGLALLMLLGRDGPLGREALGFDLHLLFTWRGAVLAAAVMSPMRHSGRGKTRSQRPDTNARRRDPPRLGRL